MVGMLTLEHSRRSCERSSLARSLIVVVRAELRPALRASKKTTARITSGNDRQTSREASHLKWLVRQYIVCIVPTSKTWAPPAAAATFQRPYTLHRTPLLSARRSI